MGHPITVNGWNSLNICSKTVDEFNSARVLVGCKAKKSLLIRIHLQKDLVDLHPRVLVAGPASEDEPNNPIVDNLWNWASEKVQQLWWKIPHPKGSLKMFTSFSARIFNSFVHHAVDYNPPKRWWFGKQCWNLLEEYIFVNIRNKIPHNISSWRYTLGIFTKSSILTLTQFLVNYLWIKL